MARTPFRRTDQFLELTDGFGVTGLDGTAADIIFEGGDAAAATNATGGDITLRGGAGDGTGDGGAVIIQGGVQGGGGTEGFVNFTGSSLIQFTERATVIAGIAAGEGRVWVRNDAPNVLMFTDDAGTDWVLNGAGSANSLQEVTDVGSVTTNDMTMTAASPSFTVGSGTGSPNIELRKLDAGASAIRFGVAATLRSRMLSDASEDLVFEHYDAVPTLQYTTTYRNATGEWEFPSHIEVTEFVEVTEMASITNPAAGDGRFWVRNDAPNVAMFTDDAGVDWVLNGTGSHETLAETLTAGNTTGASNISIDAGQDIRSADGAVVIGASGAIEWTEAASVPGPAIAAGEGRVWVRSDAPNVLMFTDDAGTDWVLNQAAAAATWAATLTAGNTSGGTDAVLTAGDDLRGEDEVAATGGAATVRGGSHTGGAAGAFDGGQLNLLGGDTDATLTTSSGGAVVVTGGNTTASTGVALGGDVLITGGQTASTNASARGGNVTITGGIPSIATNAADGGDVTISGGFPTNNGTGGNLILLSGDGGTGGANTDAGDITITSGTAQSGGFGGAITVTAGDSVGASAGADIVVQGSSASSQSAGDINILGGSGNEGGDILLRAGEQDATGGSSRAGAVTIESGLVSVNGTHGDIIIQVPDSPPGVNRGAGNIEINAGDNGIRNQDGGGVLITGGNTSGGGGARQGGSITLIAGNELGGASAASEGGHITLQPGTSAIGTEGYVDVQGSSTIQLIERAAVIGGIAATEGRFWVRSDTPNVPMFTDDAGTDWVLNAAGAASAWSAVLAAGNTSGGTDAQMSSGDNLTAAANNASDIGDATNAFDNVYTRTTRIGNDVSNLSGGSVQTTNATPGTAGPNIATLAAGEVTHIRAIFTANGPANADVAVGIVEQTFRHDGANPVLFVSHVSNLTGTNGALTSLPAAWAALTVSGNNIQATVTGIAATTIDWSVSWQVTQA